MESVVLKGSHLSTVFISRGSLGRNFKQFLDLPDRRRKYSDQPFLVPYSLRSFTFLFFINTRAFPPPPPPMIA